MIDNHSFESHVKFLYHAISVTRSHPRTSTQTSHHGYINYFDGKRRTESSRLKSIKQEMIS